MSEAFLYDTIRTPFGKFGGALAATRPDDLGAHVVRALVQRSKGDGAGLDTTRIDECTFGNANGAGEDNRNVARMAVLLAGLPTSVPASTINRLCGSSLDAAMSASRQVAVGDADLVLVGGVESMSRAPWVVPKPERPFFAGDLEMVSTTLGWRLVNPAMPAEWTASLGEATEQLRQSHGVTRERQDGFAARSHALADAAWNSGCYDDLVVPVEGTELTRDEAIRPGTTTEILAALRPAFRTEATHAAGGTITAGNASPMSDGASAGWIGSEDAAEILGHAPIARIASRAASATNPQDFGFAPVGAVNLAMRRAGIRWNDVAALEINEAFAAQTLVCLDAWGCDPDIVNGWGGAIAVGHPLGASGLRVLGTLAARLRAEGGRWGVAAICIGVGQGLAIVLENPNAAA